MPLQPKNAGVVGTAGNLLLDRAAGAKIVLTPYVRSERDTDSTQPESIKTLSEMVQEYAEKLK